MLNGMTPFDLVTLCRDWRWPVRQYRVATAPRHLAIATIGDSQPLRNLLGAALGPLGDPVEEGACSLFTLRRTLRRLGEISDLTVARIPRLLPLGGIGPRLPELIGAGGRVADLVRRSRVSKSDVGKKRRAFERSGLQCRIATDGAAFERFFDEHYKPLVTARFGEGVMLRERMELRRRLVDGCIVEILEDGQALGSQLLAWSGDTLHQIVAGSRLPPSDTHERGLMAALQLASLDLAEERRFQRLHVGASLPLLANGVLQSKLLFGCGLERMPFVRFDLVLGSE